MKTDKILIGNISLSKEGWQWWTDSFKKQNYPFTKWLKVTEVITKINKNLPV